MSDTSDTSDEDVERTERALEHDIEVLEDKAISAVEEARGACRAGAGGRGGAAAPGLARRAAAAQPRVSQSASGAGTTTTGRDVQCSSLWGVDPRIALLNRP